MGLDLNKLQKELKKKAIQKRKEDILREFEDLANTHIIDRTHEE